MIWPIKLFFWLRCPDFHTLRVGAVNTQIQAHAAVHPLLLARTTAVVQSNVVGNASMEPDASYRPLSTVVAAPAGIATSNV